MWLLWGFSANAHAAVSPVVRPPRLGGNVKMGVFATRSPYRPNPIGLSSVRLKSIDVTADGAPVLYVEGADLMDGTPIYDIKPYVEYADSHTDVRSGFVDEHPLPQLSVVFPETWQRQFTSDETANIIQLLSLDPRPHYQHDPERIYGMTYKDYDIRFRVDEQEGVVKVLEIVKSFKD